MEFVWIWKPIRTIVAHVRISVTWQEYKMQGSVAITVNVHALRVWPPAMEIVQILTQISKIAGPAARYVQQLFLVVTQLAEWMDPVPGIVMRVIPNITAEARKGVIPIQRSQICISLKLPVLARDITPMYFIYGILVAINA
jgi:hypothetical protein